MLWAINKSADSVNCEVDRLPSTDVSDTNIPMRYSFRAVKHHGGSLVSLLVCTMSTKQASNAGGISPRGRHRSWLILVAVVMQLVGVVQSWNPSRRFIRTPVKRFGEENLLCWHMAQISDDANVAASVAFPTLRLEAIAYAGLQSVEFELVKNLVESAFVEVVGATVTCQTNDLLQQEEPCKSPSIIGALGRVLLVYTNLDDDTIDSLQLSISEQMDGLLYSVPPLLKQPVLVKLQNNNPVDNGESNGQGRREVLQDSIENEVDTYQQHQPISSGTTNGCGITRSTEVCPTIHLELDAAEVTDPFSSTTWTDTSTILVFDELVDEDLRKRLLDVVLGSNAQNWNDVQNGPDPNRWIRGGLLDVTTETVTDDPLVDDTQQTSCWGLRDEVVDELCNDRHDAIEEFDSIAKSLSPICSVTSSRGGLWSFCLTTDSKCTHPWRHFQLSH